MHKYSNPFPGIRSFEPNEHKLFFGRKQKIKDILSLLFQKKFVAVLGASGCGKSSLIKAGVIPALFNSKDSTTGNGWKQIYFRPGENPLLNLAESIFDSFVEENSKVRVSVENVLHTLNGGENALVELLKEKNREEAYARLIYVDQFEEIFRFKLNKESKLSFEDVYYFVRLLLYTISQTEVPVYIIISLRSDFLGECTEFKGLPEAINIGSYLVPRMSDSEKRETVLGPLNLYNVEIENDLVDQLILDAGNSPDQLLVLQHAMMRTWDYWSENNFEENALGFSHYKAIGQMSKALSYHGEQIYNELQDQRLKKIAERVFKSLVTLKDGRIIRSPLPFSEICVLVDASKAEVLGIVDKFREPGNSFLLPVHHVAIDDDTVIDISHESVMTVWERARNWAHEEQKSVELYLRLSRSAAMYHEGKTGLWINPDLEVALNWRKYDNPNKTWAKRYDPTFERAMSFLDYCKMEYDNEINRKEKQQKRKLKLTRFFAIFLGAASVISIMFLIVALHLRYKALQSEKTALEKQREAVSASILAKKKSKEAIAHKKIAEQQQKIAEQQRIIAEEQKKFAIDQQEIAIWEKHEADKARNVAFRRKKEADVARGIAERQKEKADSMKEIAIEQKNISEKLRRLAIARTIAIQSSELFSTSSENYELSALLAKEAYRLNLENGGFKNDPDILRALLNVTREKGIFFGHSDKVKCVGRIDNEHFFSCSDDKSLSLWKTDDGHVEEVKNIKLKSKPLKSGFFPASKSAVILTTSGKLLFWENILEKDRPAEIINMKGIEANLLAFSKQGKLAYIKNDSLLVVVNNLQKPTDTVSFVLPKRALAVEMNHSGSLVGVSLNNNMLVFYEIKGNEVNLVQQHQFISAVKKIAIDKKGENIACALANNEVMLWNTGSGFVQNTNIRHNSQINKLVFNPRFTLLASCSYDGTIKICDYILLQKEPIAINNFDNWVYDIAFSESGDRLVAGGNDKTARYWLIDPDLLVDKLSLKRKLTQEEIDTYIGL